MSLGKKLMMTTAALFAGGMLYSAPAAAQATRTWISGVGDDVNPCSRTAPCKTFQGAISKTAAGGEINCIDPGGFGGVTITKAMTIICDQIEAGVLVSGSPGFTINAGVNDVVTISGIDLFGPTSSPGTNGFNFLQGAGLNIRHTTIKGFVTAAVNFQPNVGTTAFLNMDDVLILGNGNAADVTTSAVRIAPQSNATGNVTFNNVRISNSQNVGLRIDLSASTSARANVSVNNSSFTNSMAGVQFKSGTTSVIDGTFTGNVISGNTTIGVLGNGAGVTARFGMNTITGNGAGQTTLTAITGVNPANSSTLSSYNNNILDGNFNNAGTLMNGAFSGTISPH